MSAHVLVIGPSWVGDMVMAQCLFKLLKRQDPTVCIDVVAPAWTFSLLTAMSEVNRAIEMPMGHGELKLYQRFKLARQLRKQHYTQAIVLPNSFKSALLPWLAGIPKRTGWTGECRYGLLNDRRALDKKRYPLMIEQYMALGLPASAPLPASYPHPHFTMQTEACAQTLARLQLRLSGRPILALAAGAEYGPAKRWPVEYFAEIANQKLQAGWDVWLFGSPKDKPINEEIMRLTAEQCENLAGRTELAQTLQLLTFVQAVVTNDSGLMHMAAALDKRVIALYGATSPAFTPPLSQKATVLKLDLACQPCFARTCPLVHHRCMRELTPASVLQTLSQGKLG